MRLLFGLLVLLFLGTFAPVRTMPPDPPPAVSLVTFAPIAPIPHDGGRLRMLGGWTVASNDWRFGGLSAMHVSGGQVLAFSDAGWMIRFPLPRDAAAATRRAAIGPLPGGLGREPNKRNRDVESLAVHGRYAWLGLERRNGIWRFERPSWREDGAARPAIMRKWSVNSGAEAMLRLPDGRFLVISEGRGGVSAAALFLGDPAQPGTKSIGLRYRPPAGYRITDAALLPDGRMLLLHRRVAWLEGLSAKLAIAPVPAAREGAVIEPREIGEVPGAGRLDNLEALSIIRENGRTILWIASDNDFMPIRNTVLLKLALDV